MWPSFRNLTEAKPLIGLWLPIALLGLAVGCLYGHVLQQWWLFDDPQILKHALHFSPVEYFFKPAAWRDLILFSLTPWLTLTYDLDLALFGFDPGGFYLHGLLTLWLCSVMIFLCLRPITGDLHAGLAAGIFLLGTPVSTAVHELMVRHYLEGLMWALCGFWCYRRGLLRTQLRWHWLAAGCFALAFTAKEVYVPVALLVCLWPVALGRYRWRAALPLIGTLLLYAVWRKAMLGDWVGGYVPAGYLAGQRDGSALARFAAVPGVFWSWPLMGGVAVLGVWLIGLWQSRRRGRWCGLTLMVAGIALAPLVPLAFNGDFGAESARFFMVPWVLLVMGTSAVLARLQGPARARAMIAAAIYAWLAWPAWQQSQLDRLQFEQARARYEVQGHQLLALRPDERLWASDDILPHYLAGLRDLREAMGYGESRAIYWLDEAQVLEASLRPLRVLRAQDGQIRDVTAEIPPLLSAWRASLRADPLSVSISLKPSEQALSWDLGPAAEGAYAYLSGETLTAISAHGALRRERPLDACFRIRLIRPSGERVYSPPLKMAGPDAQGYRQLAWQGRGDLFESGVTAFSGCDVVTVP